MVDEQEEEWKEEKQILDGIIDDIKHEITVFQSSLLKAPRYMAAARRTRVATINLGKLFKRYRKYSVIVYPKAPV